MKVKLLGIAIIVALIAVAGCSSGGATTTTGAGQETTTSAQETTTTGAETTTTAPAETTTTAAAAAAISLPDGWTIDKAISAAEVGTITGETMTFFPEGASAAQKGFPVGSYQVAGKEGSKIRFEAKVDGGTEGFEKIKGFAKAESIKEVSGVGDKAFVCEFSATDHGIVVLKGDLVVRIDWNPTVYTADKAEFGTKLAQKLLANLYK